MNFIAERTTKRWPCLGSQEAWGVNWVHTPWHEGPLSPSICYKSGQSHQPTCDIWNWAKTLLHLREKHIQTGPSDAGFGLPLCSAKLASILPQPMAWLRILHHPTLRSMCWRVSHCKGSSQTSLVYPKAARPVQVRHQRSWWFETYQQNLILWNYYPLWLLLRLLLKQTKSIKHILVYLEYSKSNNMPAKVIGQKTTASSQDHLGPGHLLEMNLPLS